MAYEFKVGQKVLVKEARYDTHLVGKIITISHIDADGRVYLVGDKIGWNRERAQICLEPVNEKPERYTGELREGMRVHVVDIKPSAGGDFSGEKVIQRPRDKDYPWRYRSLKDDSGWGYLSRNAKGEWWAGKYLYISRVISEPKEKKEELKKTIYNIPIIEGDDCLPGVMYMVGDGFGKPAMITNSPDKGAIKTLMDTLKSIPTKVKRFLNANYRAFYRLGWVDEELDLTDDGQTAFIEYLFDKYEDDFGGYAEKKVAKIKREAKKKEDEE